MWVVRITFNDQNESTLTHYGVKGMKWGVRKEYEYTGGGRAKKNFFGKRKTTYNQPSVTDKIKDTIDNINKKKDSIADKVVDNTPKDTVIKTKYGDTSIDYYDKRQRKGKESFVEIVDKKNPGRYAPKDVAQQRLDNLPKYVARLNSETEQVVATNHNSPNDIRKVNCFHCSMAYEMRKRGYNVQAKEINGGFGPEAIHAFDVKDAFEIKVSPNETSSQNKEDLAREAYYQLQQQCLSYGNGARGILGIQYAAVDSGHAMNWIVENGEFKIINSQSSNYNGHDIFLEADVVDEVVQVYRLDNAEVLPGVTDFVEAFEATEEEKAKAAEKKNQPTLNEEREREKAKANAAKERPGYEKKMSNQEKKMSIQDSKRKTKVTQKAKNFVSKAGDTVKSVSSKVGKTAKELTSKGKSFVSDLFAKKL